MIDVARTDDDSNNRRGGVVGSTDKSFKLKEDAIITTNNEIARMFNNAKENADKKD